MTTVNERVSALRSTWRNSAEHLAEQLYRFIRLTILAAIPSISSVIFSQHFDWKTLLAFILPFAEVAFRQVFPALGAAKADSAPGTVTVVADSEDGLAAVPLPVNTDNGPRPEDPVDQPSQDPTVEVTSDVDVAEVLQAPADNSDPVEEGA
jgi:hypothetical protein